MSRSYSAREQEHLSSVGYRAVPTPHGNIGVDWAGESGADQFSMQVTAPTGTTGTIAVPTYGASNPIVEVNGATVWTNGAFTPHHRHLRSLQ